MNHYPAVPPHPLVGRDTEWAQIREFVTSKTESPTLGIVWGRRRVGKSFLLQAMAEQSGGFYYEAIRGSSAEALRDLGERLATFLRLPTSLAFVGWEEAIHTLLSLGSQDGRLVVLDEFPYLLEHTPSLPSLLQRALGEYVRDGRQHRTRLVLCGSAMTVMGGLLGGTAALRGRAAMDLRIDPFDYRAARELQRVDDLATAFRTYATIGGVAAYAREMVDNDLPSGAGDFDRWVCRRVLSPAAPLFHEIDLLLSEDPTASNARRINLYHGTLAGVATGHHSHSKLTSYLKISGASLAPILDALISAGFLHRLEDPVRDNRAQYVPADPLLRFHYAITRRHRSQFGRHGVDVRELWQSLRPTFLAQVQGPCFEAAARTWVERFADPQALGGFPALVGPSVLHGPDGTIQELDVVAVEDQDAAPSARRVLALGEAKAGERLTHRHLHRLETARNTLGPRAHDARLLLFGASATEELLAHAAARPDVDVIDLERLYGVGLRRSLLA